jgi:hypothetical protein
LTSEVPRCQHVGEADPTKKLGTNAVRNHIDHFRSVLRWIVNRGTEWRYLRLSADEAGLYKGFADDVLKGFSAIVPPDANVEGVADAIVKVVDAPYGKRPFRVHRA